MAPSQFTVAILPLGEISILPIELTAGVLEEDFGVKTIILPAVNMPPRCFDKERGRYKNRFVLDFLFSQLPPEAQRIMGLVPGKLENDENEPCLGCSYAHDRTAAYSVLPLSEWEHLPAKVRLSEYDNYYILAAHEFAHTLGLQHCGDLDCLMHKSATKEQLCTVCNRWADRELKVPPGSAEDIFSLAESNFLTNNIPKAIELYEQAINLSPDEPLYHHRLGATFYATEQFERSKEELRRAAVLADDHINFYCMIGLTFLRNQPKKAAEFFSKAVAETEEPKKIHKLIGQAYREIAHDVERASRHYKEYLHLGGDDQDVIDWLVSRSQLEQP